MPKPADDGLGLRDRFNQRDKPVEEVAVRDYVESPVDSPAGPANLLLNGKIKATVAMLADPDFAGLDELRTLLADLKANGDTLEARLKPQTPSSVPAISAKELWTSAAERFAERAILAACRRVHQATGPRKESLSST